MDASFKPSEIALRVMEDVRQIGGCPRRRVGAVITDVNGQPLSVAANGPMWPMVCSDDTPCPGRWDEKGNSSRCYATHAEVIALMRCPAVDRAHTLYVPCTPCASCAKMLLVTPIRHIVTYEDYADTHGRDIRRAYGVTITYIPKPQES
jgi:deoxycytidylate deaminase